MNCNNSKDKNRICVVGIPIKRYFLHEFGFMEKSIYETSGLTDHRKMSGHNINTNIFRISL